MAPFYTEPRRFKIFEVQSSNDNEKKVNLKKIAEEILAVGKTTEWWKDDTGYKYSIVKPIKINDRFFSATFAQEHEWNAHEYAEDKTERVNELNSFDDRLIVIDTSNNLLIVEWRQFRLKKPLTLHLFQTRIEQVISNILNGPVYLIEMYFETTNDQFKQLFYKYRVLEIKVNKFASKRVPDDVELVNPIKQLEGAARDMIEHDRAHPSIEKLWASANSSSGGGDLRRSIIARAALHSGNTDSLKYEDDNQYIRVRLKRQSGELEIQIPVFENDSIEARTIAANQIIYNFQDYELDLRRPLIIDQPSLFK
jgi:hypothetical protein